MSFDFLQEQWKKSFEKSVNSIKDCLTAQADDYQDMAEFRTLANWMLTTNVSSYEFMPSGYQNYSFDPYSTDSVLRLIHHALLDDGDVSFVTMKHNDKILRVFMMFCCRHEDYFTHYCLKENASTINMKIDFAKRTNSVRQSMKNQLSNNPHLELQLVPEEKDFVFVAHRNPLQFIQEVEDLEKFKQQQRIASEKRRLELLNQM